MTVAPADQVARVFVELADTLVEEFDLIEFLHLVAADVGELVDVGVVGILLADDVQQLHVVAASDGRTDLVELFEVQAVEGPSEDCFRSGTAVSVPDLGLTRDRWPRFAHLSVGAGFTSAHAFPLRLRRTVIGTLNLLGGEPGGLAGPDLRVVQALADVATIALLQQRAVRRGERLTDHLQSALRSRIALEQATGALAYLRHCAPDEAVRLLRTYTRTHQLHLGDVALAVVADPSSHPELTGA